MSFGIILINKPKDRTSFSIIAQMRRVIGIRKMGHTGTLDPFAEGLLPVCIGKATRLVDRLITDTKTYEVVVKLGEKTDTGDVTGNVIETKPVGEELPLDSLSEFVLNLKNQIPPKYSAIKINGHRAYKLARLNRDFKMESRPIEVFDFSIIDYQTPILKYSVKVSKGTYIRTLSESIAEHLGTVGVTTELVRTEIGRFRIEDAVLPDDLTAENWQNYLIPIPQLFPNLEQIVLDDDNSALFANGRTILGDIPDNDELIAVDTEGNFLGFCLVEKGNIKPRMVFVSGKKYSKNSGI
ncbi:MAG: tRNA pseudouridine(55) synthase TruB [Candidatus Cloacimonetes bacterium]|nr:tRNA pseudouridine(55) synthase TruB [Candidatus Cloacimonadota bacterium]